MSPAFRDAIDPQERLAFLETVAQERSVARVHLGLNLMAELNRMDQARVDRLALSRELEYLEMRQVVRAPKKAKRPSRAERQKMLATPPGTATGCDPPDARKTAEMTAKIDIGENGFTSHADEIVVWQQTSMEGSR